MTIQEVQQAAAALAAQLTQQIQAFEKTTGCIVHSLPVVRQNPAAVQVKVQIP